MVLTDEENRRYWLNSMNLEKMSLVKMKSMKELVRKKVIKLIHVSDDGEFVRYKILPNGPEVGQWNEFGQILQVVKQETVHINFLKAYPQLFEEEVITGVVECRGCGMEYDNKYEGTSCGNCGVNL